MITVKSYRREYKVNFIDSFDFISELLQIKNRFVIVDANIVRLYGKQLNELVSNDSYVVDAIEENKTLETVLPIIEKLTSMESKKNTNIIAIGGGIIQDISCFIASILYRGINWYLVPTTLLAQTDSCIGSKSSINYKNNKNLLGTFYPPTEIFVCPEFINTLTDKDYKSGLGEIVKCLLMSSVADFREFKDNLSKLLVRDKATLLLEMNKTLNFKKKIIEMDEFDNGIRNIMNYGHTFGHAIESATEYAIPHGQAVSIGVLIANRISVERGLISKQYEEEIFNVIAQIISKELVQHRSFNSDEIIRFMRMDKKYTGTHNCILLSNDGAHKVEMVPESEIKNAIELTLLSIKNIENIN